MVDLDLIYNVSLDKLRNFQTSSESDGLRKLVLLNNFVCKRFVSPEQEETLEWSEEDIKRDEEIWLKSILERDRLEEDEDEDGYICISKPIQQSTVASFPIDCYDDPLHYEDHYIQGINKDHSHEQSSKNDNVIIPHDLLHLPLNMVIQEHNNIRNNVVSVSEVESFSENLTCEKGFHPYWKDNSIIDPLIPSQTKSSIFPHLNFCIPKIFHKYRRPPLDSSIILEFLQPDQSFEFPYYESSLKRSKDDLDILYSLNPKDLDHGVLMDMISMLEYYGVKTNHNNSEFKDIWFVGNNK